MMMLTAPLATFFLYRSADAAPTWSAAADRTPSRPTSARMRLSISKPIAGPSFASRQLAPEIFPFLVQAWLIGVALFSLRSAGGFLLVERMRRRQSIPVAGKLRDLCLDLQERIGL